MEDEKRNIGDSAATAVQDGSGDENVTAEGKAPEAGGADDSAQPSVSVQELEAKIAELKEDNLRLRADMDNLFKRTERDKAEFSKYAISEFARDIVGVGDNIRRAIESVPKDALSPNSPLASLLEGVQVTERELLKVLERYQVTRFDPIREQFNPHLHDAMTKVEQPNVPANTVVQVIHAGYMIGERVLRPAAVIVAKGGSMEKPSSLLAETDIPPGAMKVPDDAVSSLDVRNNIQQEAQSTTFGRQLGNDRKHSGGYKGASEQESVAQFRRGQSGSNRGESSKSQQGAPGGKSTILNTPILTPKSK